MLMLELNLARDKSGISSAAASASIAKRKGSTIIRKFRFGYTETGFIDLNVMLE